MMILKRLGKHVKRQKQGDGNEQVRKKVKQRRARLINQQDHIAFLKCKGCPKKRAYDPTKKCRRCKTYRELRSIGKELD